MLKKLNGKITKLLFYIKNNFLSCTFKLSVIATMLIIIYLVCILSRPNAARSSDVRPIENSQKLMMTVPTEIPYNLDSLFRTTEAMTTTANFIPKTSSYFDTHPLFPIQEQTTASMDFDQTTKSGLERETTAETGVIANPEYATPLEIEFTIGETKMWQSTTESYSMEGTPNSNHSEDHDEEGPTTNSMLSSTTNLPNATTEITFISTTIDVPESDDLFLDNWPTLEQPLKIEDGQIHLRDDENSFKLSDIKEPLAESFFLNDDNEFNATVPPVPIHESESTPNSKEEIRTPSSIEEVRQSHEVFSNAKVNKNKMFVSSLIGPGNFFNLFNTDHIPATSNRKPVWWANPKNTQEYLQPSSVKGRKRHTSGIHPIYESDEVYETPRIFNRLFNRKLKDSMNFLERFFGNLVME